MSTNPVPSTAGRAPQNGLGTAALVLGIVQFFCGFSFFIPFAGLGTIVVPILALIFGKIGMNKAAQGLATNGGMAKAGFILGIIGVVLSVLGIILWIVAFVASSTTSTM